jgi:hypothetical protein
MARGENVFNVAVLSRENVDDRQSLQDDHLKQAGKEQSHDITSMSTLAATYCLTMTKGYR